MCTFIQLLYLYLFEIIQKFSQTNFLMKFSLTKTFIRKRINLKSRIKETQSNHNKQNESIGPLTRNKLYYFFTKSNFKNSISKFSNSKFVLRIHVQRQSNYLETQFYWPKCTKTRPPLQIRCVFLASIAAPSLYNSRSAAQRIIRKITRSFLQPDSQYLIAMVRL